ncbi:GH1 family beta-glucosidase [Piscinibacter gummiphilus]|uniref:Beta-glucosidase n=1 Tax=Piscinibacter gummiphilus TaxID=946333 RepID=A0A1W6L9P5_9BURK|nr:GH1 family beta-glucosidase [Piscinibacter gummiphilus]ARN21021.1 beta-galactosidase [Piscinibacter gummiphilus]ATU65696.1 beta-glucosidase [Piscinibacter gummiphilus]GLS93559.1 beta-glucosidase [Piscinibacter gummiphilus]
MNDLSNDDVLSPPPGSPLWLPDFLFGAGTAAYQIEGGVAEGGRVPTIWDTFCARPGAVRNGESGVVACDHYHRWQDDIDLVASLGLDAYRLSVAWSRVMRPDGSPNAAGLDFYERILDRLAHHGIRAFVTLYHWDLPQHLQDRGGWLNRDTASRLADFADVASRRLGDRVAAWATVNEPWCAAWLGHGSGVHAPGLADVRYAVEAMHHLLLGHGLATAALRANGAAQVGLVTNVTAVSADSQSPEDRQAARLAGACWNHWVLDPLLLGTYPEALQELWPGVSPSVRDGDMALISTPMDYIGINYYFRANVRSDGAHGYADKGLDRVERTVMGWEVYPAGLRDLLIGFKGRYPALPPVHITENGMASDDDTVVDGRVDDAQRVRYLQRHLVAIGQAMRAGVDVRGYFAWSLLDNFEWVEGYAKRFGIVHVDYATQQRTPKDSALALKALMAARRKVSGRFS